MATVDVDVNVYDIISLSLPFHTTTTIAEVKQTVAGKTTIPVADIKIEVVKKHASNDFIKNDQTTLGEIEERDGKIWLGLRSPTRECLMIANHLAKVGFQNPEPRSCLISLVITVKDFRTPEHMFCYRAFTIKADCHKSPVSMYVEGICENERFNKIKMIDGGEWKAMWFHNGKPLNHPFNSLYAEGVKDNDEIEVHLVKADDKGFLKFHEDGLKKMKKTMDGLEKSKKTMDEKDGYPSVVEKPDTCVPTSPSLADVPASSDQPPAPVLPTVQDEMSLADLQTLIAEREENLKELKKNLSAKKKEEKSRDITVHLRQPSGNTFPVITKASKTVRQFKEQDVAELLHKSWDDIMLLMGHEQMKLQKQLHTYGVRDGSTIDILLRIRGGDDNTMVDAKVFNIVPPLPIDKAGEEEASCEEEEDDHSFVEHYKHLGVMDYIYGCEIDKDDVITDAMALYASSFCDMFDNPKTIMVKEFRGRSLFSIEIDKYDTISAKNVKKEIANRLQFLAKQKGSSIYITEDDFMLNGLGDNDRVCDDVELLLRLRGGGVGSIKKTNQKPKKLTMLMSKATSVSQNVFTNDLAEKCRQKALEVMNHSGNSLVATAIECSNIETVRSMLQSWNEGSEIGERFSRQFSCHFLPLIAEADKCLDELSDAREALIASFQVKFAQEFMGDGGKYSLKTIEDMLVSKEKSLLDEVATTQRVQAEVARQMAELQASSNDAMMG